MAAGTKVGTGYVEIKPDFSGFQESVERSVRSRFRKIGDDAGRTLTDSVGQRVRRDRSDLGTSFLLAPIVNRFKRVGEDAGKGFSRGAAKGARASAGELSSVAKAMERAGISLEKTAGSRAKAMRSLERDTFGVGRAAKKAGANLLSESRSLRSVGREAHATGGATRSLTGHLRSLGSELRSARRDARAAGGGFRGFDGTMARVNRSAQFFRNILRLLKWPAVIASVGLLAQGLSALAAGFVAATSAVGPLVGALVALPSAALVAAQAMGALKLATAGIGAAVKAALDVEVSGGGQAVDVLKQQERAAERVADAKRNLTDVQREARKAQDDLREARESATRQLDDMRRAAEGTGLSESEAVLSLQQARKDLAQTLRDPAASGLDEESARQAVERAKADLENTRVEARRTREDYRDAKKAGVEGMPEVVAAKEAEGDANRAVADANRDLKQAVEESTEAMKDQGAAASTLQEKMSQLPPAAQKFVRFLVAMKPRLDALRATAAQGLLPGAETGIRSAMRNFGVFRGIIGGTSKALGGLAAKAGRKLGTDAWGKDLGRLGKLNTRIIDRLGDSTLNLADGFRHVLVAAEPFLDWLSESTKGFSEWIAQESAAGRESGKLAAFFDRTRETMERVWPILKGVGGALLNIGEAARPLGNEILDSLGGAAEGWRKWTDSTKGQNTLKRYFTETKPAVFEMGRLIRDAGKAFFELGKQDGVAELLRLVRTELIPAMRDLVGGTTGWAAKFLREFGELRKEGVPTFDALIQTLADHAGQAGIRIAKSLANAFLNAGIWGKLAISGWLLAKFGGFRVLGKWGLEAGGRMGEAFFLRAWKWIAGTKAGEGLLGSFNETFSKDGKFGKASRTAGGRMGKILSRSMVIGAVAGLALLAPTIAEALNKYVVEPAKKAYEDLFGDDVGGFLGDAVDLVGKNIPSTLNPAAPIIREAFGGSASEVGDYFGKGNELPEPKTDKARRGFERFRKQVGKEAELTRTVFRNQLAPIPGVAEQSARGVVRQWLPRLDALKIQGGQKGDAFAGRLGGSFGSVAGAARGAFANIEENIRGALKALSGTAVPSFNLKLAPKLLNMLPPLEKQQGGFIVPGSGSGDTFRTALPAGSFIENREAVRRLPFQAGGLLPVALEPGERVYMPSEVKAFGRRTLEARNAAVPRFQSGGLLGQPFNVDGAKPGFVPFMNFLNKLFGPIYVMSGLRPGSTVAGTGAISNHSTGNAVDISTTQNGLNFATDEASLNATGVAAKRMDALHAYMARNIKLPGDFLWRTFTGGNHYNHIHRGITSEHASNPALMAQYLSTLPSGGAFAALKKFVLEGPDGPMKALGQRAIDIVWKAANERMNRGFTTPNFGLGKSPRKAHEPLSRMLGGIVQRFRGGGFVGNINRVFDGATLGGSGDWAGLTQLPDYVIAALAEAAGDWRGNNVPGVTMMKVQKHEGANRPGSMSTDAGYGLWAMTKPYADAIVAKLGGYAEQLNPVKSAAAMAMMYTDAHRTSRQALINTWHGAAFNVTGLDEHYSGPYDIRNALGGLTFSEALAGKKPKEGADAAAPKPKPMPGQVSGDFVRETVIPNGKEPDEFRAIKRKYNVQTGPLAFGGVPSTIKAIQKELAKRRLQLDEYNAAAGEAKRKDVKEALLANAKRLRKRISDLIRKRTALRIATKFGFKATREQKIDAQGTRFEELRETAEKVMSLEPEEGPEATAYIRDRETPAWQAAFDQLGVWRNAILGGQEFATNRLAGLAARIRAIRELKKTNPDIFKRQKFRIPALETAAKQVREVFNPGPPPSGRLEESLTEVQGPNKERSRGPLPSEPDPSGFGGIVWDTQMQLRDLGVRLKQSLGGGEESSSELAELTKELLRQTNLRSLVEGVAFKTFRDFEKEYAIRDLPKFHDGGVVPGPPNREIIAKLRGQERVVTGEQWEAAAAGAVGGSPTIENLSIVVHEDGTATVDFEGREFKAAVRREMRDMPTRLVPN